MRACNDQAWGWVQQKLEMQLISTSCLGGFWSPGVNEDILPIPALCKSLWGDMLLSLLHGWTGLGGRSRSTGSVQHLLALMRLGKRCLCDKLDRTMFFISVASWCQTVSPRHKQDTAAILIVAIQEFLVKVVK